jgi:hypothetical protein
MLTVALSNTKNEIIIIVFLNYDFSFELYEQIRVFWFCGIL